MEGESDEKFRKKVMVVIDESKYSYNALMWVLNNLKESLTDLPVILFMPQPLPDCNYTLGFPHIFSPVSAIPELLNSVQEQNNKVTFGILEKAKSICLSRGIKAETVTDIGDPKAAICKAVQMYKINLLVLGDHSSISLKRAFMGNLSNYCLNNAKCPVLVVKEP